MVGLLQFSMRRPVLIQQLETEEFETGAAALKDSMCRRTSL